MDKILILISTIFLSGCAIMHHTQVGEVDSQVVLKGKRFEILVSEVGVNFEEISDIGQALTRNKQTKREIEQVQSIIALFQMGPRTGNHVFSKKYADKIFDQMRRECPNGRISGLTSIRETAKYPVVSGEIVKIIGYCKQV